MGKTKSKIEGNSNMLVEALQDSKRSASSGSNKLKDLPVLDDGATVEELALQTGRSVETIRERLKGLLAEGRLAVGRKQTKNLIGLDVWVPSYKIVE